MDGMEFTPVNNLTLHVEPTMPSMGHGSLGNVDPTLMNDAWYRGEINLTMSGEWQLSFDATAGNGMMMPPFTVEFMIDVP